MAYDALAESLRLLESRELAPVTRLSRRRRHVAMAVDVADDIAVTMFVRRSVGCIVEEIHVLARHAGEWFLLGGGGGPAADDALEYRPAELDRGLHRTPGVDPRVLSLEGSGGIWDGRARRRPWPSRGRWINYGTMQVNADVARVATNDRQVAVPWHGRVVIAWPGRRPQELAVLDNEGRRLGKVTLPPSP